VLTNGRREWITERALGVRFTGNGLPVTGDKVVEPGFAEKTLMDAHWIVTGSVPGRSFAASGSSPHRSRTRTACGVARHGNGQISECQGRGEIRRAETPVGVHRVGIDRGANAGGGQALVEDERGGGRSGRANAQGKSAGFGIGDTGRRGAGAGVVIDQREAAIIQIDGEGTHIVAKAGGVSPGW